MRISNSFSEGEIQVMDFIVQSLLRGGSPAMATRNKDFASMCRKIIAMKAKVHEKQLADSRGEPSDAAGDAEAIAADATPAQAETPSVKSNEDLQHAV